MKTCYPSLRRAPRVRPLAASLGLALAIGSLAWPSATTLAAPGPALSVAGPESPAAARSLPTTGARGAALAALLHRAADPRPATTLVVSNCDDAGPGSLREAMTNAVDGDTIDATGLVCSVISLQTGALSTNADNVTIAGPGVDALTIDAGYDTNGLYQSAIYHFGSGTLGIEDMTIADAKYVGPSLPTGGCIYSTGSVYLSHSLVTGCAVAPNADSTATSRGGGVFAAGEIELKYSTLNYNLALSSSMSNACGGGLYAGGGLLAKYSTIDFNIAGAASGFFGNAGGACVIGDASVRGTTVSRNFATRNVAGLQVSGNSSNSVEIIGSTISGNVAYSVIGGMFSSSPVTIENSTIAFNHSATDDCSAYGYSPCDAGLHVQNTTGELQSSIISDNLANGVPSDVSKYGPSADLTAGANNLVTASDALLAADTITDDPMLFPLSDNGGPTRTHALAAGSPAIDAGNNSASLTYDQRLAGHPREVGAAADIGAFERQGPGDGDFIFVDGFDP